ncbi:signal transduction protein [Thermotomaculum hydrothermale]|uniref:diguanylate cyclase n=1 Tax=Thermotomaculum hydrothermale TaxID=981385 RepID=A0A7R6PL07_9BACT|nr:diguanylate cyclase [Thermotomaculum hydrothermale]BBB32062.1 signal transduction protein [Thermotomaculum hydrothermale]
MKKKLKLLIIIIILFSIFPIKAQYLPLRVYTSADGLASNQVRDIKNDSNGALWIGCGSGLSYFTGFKFINYGLKEGLPGISILKIQIIHCGHIFILTYNGLAYKKTDEDYFKKIPIDGEIVDFFVREKHKKSFTIIVCIKNQGIYCYLPEKGQIENFWNVKNPYSIVLIKEKAIVSLENGGIYSIDLKTKKHSIITRLNTAAKLKKINEKSLFAISENKVIKITDKGKKFETEKLYSSKDKTLVIFDATISKNNELWIGTNKYLIKKSKKKIKYYTTENGLPELPIFSIFENNDGILWFGTNSGLAKLVNNDITIFKKIQGKDIKSCISLFWDKTKKEMWAGINRGVATIKNQKVRKFENNYLNQYIIWAIEKDNKGNYYFATEGGGVVKLTPQGKTIIFKKENHCLPDNRITDLLYLKNTLYVSTKNGFAVLKNNKWKIFTTANGLPASYIRCIEKDEKGNIYLSTYGAGIIKFKNGEFSGVIKNLKNEFNTIYALSYKNGTFWAACNYGLVKIKDGIAKLYNSKYGFPNYSGVSVLALDNYVWMGTDGGACLFDINAEKVVEILTKDEGLPGNEFTTHNAICKDSENNVWIGVFGGIAKISKKIIAIKNKQFNPKVYLTNITYRYHKQTHKLIPLTNLLEIPYGAKDITFNLDVIWFRNDYSMAIYYKLDGENETWQKLENMKNTKVMFNFLTYGEYTLKLKIVNLAGNNQSIEKKIVSFKVLKPWWAKEWVILTIILLLLVLGAFFTLYFTDLRTKHLKEEKQRLDKLVAEKTRQLQKVNEELIEKNKMLLELAEKDFLTGLYNRRHAIKVLKIYQKLAERENDFKISFILIDIDFFKIINDTYGHDAGDFVLKQLARLMKENTRKSDIVARWGGEEFLIILPKTNLEQAKIVAEKLRKIVEETEFQYKSNKIKFTISAGLTSVDLTTLTSDKEIEKILLEVDKKLYQAKERGRNLIIY